MSYRIELIPPARAEIRALPGHVRHQALELASDLGQEPRPPRAKRLDLPPSGVAPKARPDLYRIWLAGRWRVSYEIDDEAGRVLVLCLRRKQDVDFDTLPSWMHDSGVRSQPIDGINPPPQ